MIDRRTFVGAVAGALLASPFTAEAQLAAKIARIGYLNPNTASANPRLFETFRQGLRDLGYVEGRSVQIEFRSAEAKPERLHILAAELVALRVDVIVTGGGTLAALAARQATGTLPIVFNSVGDPVTSGLVESLARPGAKRHGVVPSVPGAGPQVPGTAQAGGSGGQSGRRPLAVGCRSRTHGKGHRSRSRSRGADEVIQ